MHRFYAEAESLTGGTVLLSPEDSRHVLTVLRLKAGQHIEMIMDGRRWEAEVSSTDHKNVYARILSPLPSTEPALSVTLFQGLPKGDKMDLIVQKSTELGISRIVPVLLNRCVVRPEPKDLARKMERWRKIAREAGKQSGRCLVPEITEPVSLRQLCGGFALPDKNIVPWEEASGFGPLAFHSANPRISSLGILIGPEGGIEKEEIVSLKDMGFVPVTLGKRILRTETAGIAAVSSMMSLYGEME